jgi:hypothetical protein
MHARRPLFPSQESPCQVPPQAAKAYHVHDDTCQSQLSPGVEPSHLPDLRRKASSHCRFPCVLPSPESCDAGPAWTPQLRRSRASTQRSPAGSSAHGRIVIVVVVCASPKRHARCPGKQADTPICGAMVDIEGRWLGRAKQGSHCNAATGDSKLRSFSWPVKADRSLHVAGSSFVERNFLYPDSVTRKGPGTNILR